MTDLSVAAPSSSVPRRSRNIDGKPSAILEPAPAIRE